LLVLITACVSDVPPEPNAPGISGNYYLASYAWATEPVGYTFEQQEDSYRIIINDHDFIYQDIYIWNELETRWAKFVFPEDTKSGTPWIENTVALIIPKDDLHGYKDDANELYAVAYACNKVSTGWDCHNNKWMLDVMEVTAALIVSPPVADPEPTVDPENSEEETPVTDPVPSESGNPIIIIEGSANELPLPPVNPNSFE
jgi:hypothetical protein